MNVCQMPRMITVANASAVSMSFVEDATQKVGMVNARTKSNLKGTYNMKNIEKNFTYHAPKEGQPERYTKIRELAKELAEFIETECPDSREKSLSFTKIEEAVMWANASIARNE